MEVDIAANRRDLKYSKRELIWRILWMLGQIFFRLSPRNFFSYRRLILRMFGAQVGENVNFYPTSKVYFPWNLSIGDWSAVGENTLIYNLGKVHIGKNVTISQQAHLCAGTHDYRKPSMPLIKSPIEVGDNVWICADAFIGPGTVIGKRAIVGARAVVTKDVQNSSIVAGNPARVVGCRPLDGAEAV